MHCVQASSPGWSNGWLTAVGPSTSSLSAAISPICLQFPHSSSVASEVRADRFPTPPQSHTVRAAALSSAPMKREAVHIRRTHYPVRMHVQLGIHVITASTGLVITRRSRSRQMALKKVFTSVARPGELTPTTRRRFLETTILVEVF